MLLREILRQSVLRVTKNDVSSVSRRYCVIHLPETTTLDDENTQQTQTKRSLSNKNRFRDPLKKANTREVEQFGSWDLRMNFPLLEEQSIKRGTPIPLLNMDKVGFFTHQGRREYQVHLLKIALGSWECHKKAKGAYQYKPCRFGRACFSTFKI